MRKLVRQKPLTRRNPKVKTSFINSIINKALIVILILFISIIGFKIFKSDLEYYLGFKSDKVLSNKQIKIEKKRIEFLLDSHIDNVFGFDVSEHQDDIKWDEVGSINNTYYLKFVFIRATAGKDKVDKKFNTNWEKSKSNKFIRGAYHYYRPNENSIEQANNFIKTVTLKKGDFPPVLDIENLPKTQSIFNLKIGLKNWLDKVESHYNVKPIIYTGERYYLDFLKDEFKEYQFWIANYNDSEMSIKDNWLFWQFTEKGVVNGIIGPVDINIYNGTPKMLNYILIN